MPLDIMYNTHLEILLAPHGSAVPEIHYGIDQPTQTLQLVEPQVLTFDFDRAAGPARFVLDFCNKADTDPDTMVEIVRVTFEGITADRFKWAGVYTPRYPEVWAQTQTDLPVTRPRATHLGWNGRWELEFTVPIFTWIHRTECLGWIYE